jgi:hypothetical protein
MNDHGKTCKFCQRLILTLCDHPRCLEANRLGFDTFLCMRMWEKLEAA